MAALFLSKWLQAVNVNDASSPLTEEELHVRSLVEQTLEEANQPSLQTMRPLSAQLIQTWAIVFRHQDVWGIVSIMGSAMSAYADGI